MTWEWFPFLVGAPIWASVGIVLFASLGSGEQRAPRLAERPDARVDRKRPDADHADVVSLGAYRFRRLQENDFLGEDVARGRR